MQIKSARRQLSANDLGVTGSHQAGFLIPKKLIHEGLFPQLPASQLNPRVRVRLTHGSNGDEYFMNFIHYNNKLFGGTRNEFRLTGIATLLRSNGFQVGDEIEFVRTGEFDFKFLVIKGERTASILDEESWKLIYGESNEK